MKFALPLLLLSLALASPSSSYAARPAACASGLGQSGYDAGYSAQSRVLTQLWSDHHESCDELNAFKNSVVLDLTRDLPENVFLRCRRVGMIQAFEDAISRISATCTSNCSLDLDPYAKISAQIFCKGAAPAAFAEELRKEGVQTPICGSEDWVACRQKVMNEAQAACSERATVRRDELDQLAAVACRAAQ
ncbi:hypothetical protein [Polyangium spumosum]|uniref:Uncharacterized protein n=1 Tax=Polyangium spumosum TaxID=889282 RepID=A0A6N7PQW2_9BACT|nr:hypothetical protein [Polyangium spumosum]MRG93196.1 hypothetical protein [Polyangium spumosum]